METTARSGSIDVHMIPHDQARRGRRPVPWPDTGLTVTRRAAGWALALLGLPVLTLAMSAVREHLSLPSEILIFLLLVVAVALAGGRWPAITAAVGGSLLLNYFFTAPVGEFTIAEAENLFALVVFVVVAMAVSAIVDLAARRTREAARAGADAEVLSTLAGHVLRGEAALPSLL
ncbi:DUF4118 domain-containing protein, partial [Spongiactinospora gelatinilytica]|uniref:DUF4118 domain-containing protein n=1 Tax=Spongiactinospora gelatinilytica TaxID=2666298 RepID=UPI001F3F16B3